MRSTTVGFRSFNTTAISTEATAVAINLVSVDGNSLKRHQTVTDAKGQMRAKDTIAVDALSRKITATPSPRVKIVVMQPQSRVDS